MVFHLACVLGLLQATRDWLSDSNSGMSFLSDVPTHYASFDEVVRLFPAQALKFQSESLQRRGGRTSNHGGGQLDLSDSKAGYSDDLDEMIDLLS